MGNSIYQINIPKQLVSHNILNWDDLDPWGALDQT